jgi:hypothetical protein
VEGGADQGLRLGVDPLRGPRRCTKTPDRAYEIAGILSPPDRFTDRDSRPYCWLSQRWASGSGSLLTTITFLGKRQAITDPEARCQPAGQTTETGRRTSAQRRSATRTGSRHLSSGHGGERFIVFGASGALLRGPVCQADVRHLR